jgi:hypothetical protein
MKIKMFVCPESEEFYFSIRTAKRIEIGNSYNLLILYPHSYKTKMNRKRISKYQTLIEEI